MDGGKKEVVAGLQNLKLKTGGHRRLQLLVEFGNAGIHFGGVGSWSLEDHVDGARLAVNIGREAVAHGSNLHLGHISQVQQVTAFAGAEHNIVELLDSLQCTLIFQRVLISILGLLAQ